MAEPLKVDIAWDVELPPTPHYPDVRRLQRIWVTVDGDLLGGAFVSTTGYAECVLGLDDASWKDAVERAVAETVRHTNPRVAFVDEPGPADHFQFDSARTWTHKPLAAI